MRHNTALVGIYDLKRSYRKNMAIGFGLSGMLYLAAMIILSQFIIQAKDSVNPGNGAAIGDTFIVVIPPVISEQKHIGRVRTREGRSKLVDIIPIPVPDNNISVEAEILNQDQLVEIAPETPIGELGTGIGIDAQAAYENLIPSPDTIIFYDEPPVVVSQMLPIYPALAQRSGIEGYVWIKAFIDREGSVLEVFVMKSSPSDIGFEVAALDAARQSVWKPAISNGLPVGVWITYKVEFELR